MKFSRLILPWAGLLALPCAGAPEKFDPATRDPAALDPARPRCPLDE